MNPTRAVAFVAALTLACAGAFAQSPAQPVPSTAARAPSPTDELKRGIELFANERYAEALPVFDSLFLDSRAGALRAEGAYWSAMTLLASGEPAAAEKAIDTFLTAFPGHERSQEMIYQKARAAFLAKDYERALRAFQAFIAAYPGSAHEPAALFWSAESLYSLGRLPEAERLYRAMVERHPDSPRAEAARYRVSLIQFKYREDELLTLLKWSHEESLRIIEEFQRRERAYEQALDVYQKRYGEAKRGVAETQASLEDQVTSLRLAMDDLARRLQDKDARVVELERLLGAAEAAKGASPASALSGPASPVAEPGGRADAELLAMKAQALELMRFYLERLGQSSGDKK